MTRQFSVFKIFCDENRPETSGQINKLAILRPRLFNKKNWRETETSLSEFSLETEIRLRVSSFNVGMAVKYFSYSQLCFETAI